ncbi:MAG: hypothetical protein ABIS59_00750 [Candidatus Saccharibacteria bacterium]
MKSSVFRSTAAYSIAATMFLSTFLPFTAATAATGQGIELSPALAEISARPGQSVTTTIRLRNVTNVPFVVTPHADDFTAKGDNGEPMILPDGELAPTYSMSRWVQSPGDILLEPNVYKSIAVTINVPANAEPGGHYGVVRFSSDQSKGTEKSGVSISASVGSLILLTVSGKITQSLKYVSFVAGSGSGPSKFFEKGPISFTQKVKNDGNVHEKIHGQVVILNSKGKKVGGVAVNDKGGNILPGSTRTFTESWKTKDLFGHYTATAHLAYANGKTLESPIVSFWIIPYKLIGYGILGLIVLLGLLKLFGSRYSFSVRKTSKRR